MLQYSTNLSEVINAEAVSKNGMGLKNQVSSGNFLRRVSFAVLMASIIVSFNSCISMKKADFNPTNKRLPELLPSLTAIIDVKSFEKAYLGKKYPINAALGGIYLNFPQNYANHFWDDVLDVFIRDVNWNISNIQDKNNGYIKLEVLSSEYKTHDYFFSAFFGAPFLGLPTDVIKFTTRIEVNIQNIKKETVATYIGEGKAASKNRLYVNYNTEDYAFSRKANIKSLKIALDDVKQQMIRDNTSLSLQLKKAMADINSERILAITQTNLDLPELTRANTHLQNSEFNESIAIYTNILRQYPFHIYALLNRGIAYCFAEKNTLAIKDFESVIQLEPNNEFALFYTGNAYNNLFELNTAVSYYNSAIAKSPEMADAYYMRAIVHDDLNLLDWAKRDLEKVISLNPDFLPARERLRDVQARIQNNINRQLAIEQQNQAMRTQLMLQALSQSLNATAALLEATSNTTSTTSSSSYNPTINSPSPPSFGLSAEHYIKEAEKNDREAEYCIKEYEREIKEAERYSKQGDHSKAKMHSDWAQKAQEKAKRYMDYAKEAREKAAINAR